MTKYSAQRRFICSTETKGRDKGQRQMIQEEGGEKENLGKGRKGAKERSKRYMCWGEGRTNDCLWIERRQTWPIGK